MKKKLPYLKAPSNYCPLVQHSLLALLDMMHYNKITLTKIVQK
ncbi:MAG: hypothetical protein U0V03_11910 [Bacteroidia bacterium]